LLLITPVILPEFVPHPLQLGREAAACSHGTVNENATGFCVRLGPQFSSVGIDDRAADGPTPLPAGFVYRRAQTSCDVRPPGPRPYLSPDLHGAVGSEMRGISIRLEPNGTPSIASWRWRRGSGDLLKLHWIR
jgi:hypothetical protein